MHHALQLLGVAHPVWLTRHADGYQLHSKNGALAFTLRHLEGSRYLFNGQTVHMVVDGDAVHLHHKGETYTVCHQHPLDRLAQAANSSTAMQIVAPMPGATVMIHVAVGQSVKKGEVVMVMESMKMETSLAAPADGIVAEVRAVLGQTFDRDAVLVRFTPAESA